MGSLFDITSKESVFNLNPEPVVIPPAVKFSWTTAEAEAVDGEVNTEEAENIAEVDNTSTAAPLPKTKISSATATTDNTTEEDVKPIEASSTNFLNSDGSSPLEKLYNITDGRGVFHKVVDFLGTMAEAESFKGKKTYNENSSASGIFHFLVRNGGGYTKNGTRDKLGQYDSRGVLRTSSFETAKNRLKSMISSPQYADTIKSNPVLVQELDSILKAKTPDNLTPQRQAILAYANLKETSNDFDKYLQGSKEAVDVYGKVWVTTSGSHSMRDIRNNWNNAIKRSGGTHSNYKFFGIKPVQKNPFNVKPSGFDNIFGLTKRDGGVLDGRSQYEKIIFNNTLV